MSTISLEEAGKKFGFARSTMPMSPDGRLLFVNSGQGKYRMLDLVKREVRWKVRDKPTGSLTPVLKFQQTAMCSRFCRAVRRSRSWIQVPGSNGRMIHIDIDEKRRSPAEVNSIALAPDGRRLTTRSPSSTSKRAANSCASPTMASLVHGIFHRWQLACDWRRGCRRFAAIHSPATKCCVSKGIAIRSSISFLPTAASCSPAVGTRKFTSGPCGPSH